MITRLAGVLAAAAAVGLVASGSAFACRCEPKALAEAFADADEVFLARPVLRVDDAGSSLLRFELVEDSWKSAASRSEPLAAGDTVEYRTAGSTAACGIAAKEGAGLWLVFGRYGAGEDGGHVDLCGGTQRWPDPEQGDEATILGVPVRHVVAQIQAHAAMAEWFEGNGAAAAGDRLIGLLDLKTLAHGGTVTLRSDPDAGADQVGVFESYDPLETREVGYEVPAAVVRERRDGWSRVRTRDGAEGWVAPDEAGTFFPLEELPVRRLAYWRRAAGGYLWPEPGAGLARRRPRGPVETPVEVDESTWIADSLWFRIRVLERSPCEGGDGSVIGGGWVPAYGTDGEPSVWFYSRGC